MLSSVLEPSNLFVDILDLNLNRQLLRCRFIGKISLVPDDGSPLTIRKSKELLFVIRNFEVRILKFGFKEYVK